MTYRAAWLGAAITVAIACLAVALPSASAAAVAVVPDPVAAIEPREPGTVPPQETVHEVVDETTQQMDEKVDEAVDQVGAAGTAVGQVDQTLDENLGDRLNGLVADMTAPLATSAADAPQAPSSSATMPPAVATTAAAAGAATVGIGLTAAFPGGRRALTAGVKGILRWLGALGGVGAMGLFSRIQPDQMLEHETRARILDTVSANPGISLLDLRDRMGVAWGTLNHHVHKMEAAGLLASVRQGPRRLLFAAESPEGRARQELALLHVPTARRIATAVQENPGVRQKDICDALGLNKPAASKHLARFEAAGLILVSRDGGACHYQPTPRLEAALQWNTVTPTSLGGTATHPNAIHTALPTSTAAGNPAAMEPVAA